MKKNKFFMVRMTAVLLSFAVSMVACSKSEAQASGGSSAGGLASSKSSGKEAKETDFIYELNKAGDGVIITGYQKDAAGGALVIPAKIEGYPVVGILSKGELFSEGFAYYDMQTKPRRPLTDAEIKKAGLHPRITSVVFPDTITEIGLGENYASIFGANEALKSIALPKNLKVIPDEFIGDGRKTLTSVKWPETLEVIGRNAFSATGLTEVVLPEGVKEVGEFAFASCENLTSVTIPSTIEIIGDGAFSSCESLATVKMPSKTIKYLAKNDSGRWDNWSRDNTFWDCPKLSGIAVRKAITDTGYKGKF